MARIHVPLCTSILLLLGSLFAPLQAQEELTNDAFHSNASGAPQPNGGGAVLPTGSLATSVPINLPPARGGLSVPLNIHYMGGPRAGDGGVGWGIPLSYVLRSDTLTRRIPSVASTYKNAAEVNVDSRTILRLGGGSFVMNRDGRSDRFLPVVAPQHVELWEDVSTDSWTVHDANGVTYLFARRGLGGDPSQTLGDPGLWFLTEIRDRTGVNTVVLKYAIDTSSVYTNIRLVTLEYSFAHGTRCPKYRVYLDYAQTETTFAENEYGHLREHNAVLDKIRVYSHDDVSCTETEEHRLRTYLFSYFSDPDTGLARLAKVDLRGRGSAGPLLPVGSYSYAAATHEGVLRFDGPKIVSLPADYPVGALSESTISGDTSREKAFLRDITGDGLPDAVLGLSDSVQYSPNATVEDKSDLSAVLEHTTGRAPALGSTTSKVIGELAEQKRNLQETWIQTIDWNGDGRLDVVESSEKQPNFWTVWLNTPAERDPRKILWKKERAYVGHIAAKLASRGHPLVGTGKRLSLSRSTSWTATETRLCRKRVGTAETGWTDVRCDGPKAGYDYVRLHDTKTYVEWKLIDINGDSLPDLVMNQVPVTRVIRSGGNGSCVYKYWDPATQKGAPEFSLNYCRHTVGDDARDVWECDCSEREDLISFSDISDDGISSNSVLVYYGANLQADAPTAQAQFTFTAQPRPLHERSCGVEQWIEFADADKQATTQYKGCGFEELNGDGLADYVYYFRWNEVYDRKTFSDPRAVLGDGSGHWPSSMELTGFLERFTSNRNIVCTSQDKSYERRQIDGFVDVTGDGVADKIAAKTREGTEWIVRVGRGNTFTDPIGIASPAGFDLSRLASSCGKGATRMVAGLLDIDTDGVPDLVRARPNEHAMDVWTLRAPEGSTHVAAIGRMIAIDNGYGGRQVIEYGSAKAQGRGGFHQVPFPEVVVLRVRQEMNRGLSQGATSLQPAHYRYSDAFLSYDSLLGRWHFPSYGRSVVVRGQEKVELGTDVIEGTAQITEFHTPREFGYGGYDALLYAGKAYRHSVLAGRFAASLVDVLGNSPGDLGRLRYQQDVIHSQVRRNLARADSRCKEWLPYGGPSTHSPCERADLTYQRVVESREGDPLSSDHSKETATRAEVVEIDWFGRALTIRNDGDVYDGGRDDVCARFTYHNAEDFKERDTRAWSAIASQRMTHCDTRAIYSGSRYLYDDHGLSLIDAAIQERYADGRLLDELTSSVVLRDAYQSATHTETRFLGPSGEVVRSAELVFDPFGVAIVSKKERASDVATVFESEIAIDPITMQPTVLRDLTRGGEWRYAYDGFGRLTRETVIAPTTGLEQMLTEHLYLGDDPSDAQGRRTLSREFDGNISVAQWDSTPTPFKVPIVSDRYLDAHILVPMAPASRWLAGAKQEIVYFDEIGRRRYTEEYLGADYHDQVVVRDFREFDELGRVAFARTPFVEGDEVYGVTYHYLDDSRLRCSVEGPGLQGLTDHADSRGRIFPSCVSYAYEDNQKLVTTRGPVEMDRAARNPVAENGAFHTTYLDALDRVVRQQRKDPRGVVKDEVSYEYDKLDQRRTIRRRVRNAQSGRIAVVWREKRDSVGQLLETEEPGQPKRTYAYDRVGNLREIAWRASDGRSRILRQTYDGFGRPTRQELVGDPSSLGQPWYANFVYDVDPTNPEDTSARGNLIRAEAAIGTTIYAYDRLGRLTTTRWQDAESRDLSEEVRSLTLPGRVEGFSVRTPATTGLATYAYDSAGRVRSIDYADGEGPSRLFHAQDIDDFGRYLGIELGNATIEERQYDGSGRRQLRSVYLDNQHEQWSSLTEFPQYDAEGKVLLRRDKIVGNDGGTLFDERASYEYDVAKRLSRIRVSAPPSRRPNDSALPVPPPAALEVRQEEIVYDELGNVQTRRRSDRDQNIVDTYRYAREDPDRLCAVTSTTSETTAAARIGWAPASGIGVSPTIIKSPTIRPPPGVVKPLPPEACAYKYDELGNLVDDGSRRFSYNGASLITEARGPDTRHTLHYGPFAELVERREYPPGTHEPARVEQFFGSAVRAASTQGAPDDSFVEIAIPGPKGVVALVRYHENGEKTTLYPHGDPIANRLVSDASRRMREVVKYSAFGETLSDWTDREQTPPMHNTWNGGQRLSGLGVIELGARLYDPKLGRFLQRDPIFAGSTASSMNPYLFAHGDPVNFVDPTGLDEFAGVEMLDAGVGDSPSSNLTVVDYTDSPGLWVRIGQPIGGALDGLAGGLNGLIPGVADNGPLFGNWDVYDQMQIFGASTGEALDYFSVSVGMGTATGSAACMATGVGAIPCAPTPALGVGLVAGGGTMLQHHRGKKEEAQQRLLERRGSGGGGPLPQAGSSVGPTPSVPKQIAGPAAGGTGQAAGRGFRSFSAFKRAVGLAGPGQQWHHIVEKGGGNVRRFGAETIHSTSNVVRVEASVHRQISGFYSSKPAFAGGQTVRQWLRSHSFEQQMQFGLETLRRFGGAP